MERAHSRVTKRLRGGAVWVVALALPATLLGLFFLYPLTAILARGFSGEAGAGFAEVLSRGRVHDVIAFTLLTASAATAACVVLAVPVAHVLYRTSFPAGWGWVQAACRGVVAVPFVLPSVVVGVAFKTLLGPGGPLAGLGWQATPAAIILALVFFNLGVLVRTLGTSWAGIDPRPEQAARSLGASAWRAFWTVTWPGLRPALTSGALIVFLFCATAFGVVLILGELRYATLETEIYLLTTQFLDLQAAAVLGVLQLVLCLVLILAYRPARRSRIVATAQGPHQRRLGKTDTPALLVLLVVVGGVITPLVTLVLRSLRAGETWTLRYYAELLTGGGQSVAGNALRQSLSVATDATVLALLAGLPVAGFLAHSARGRALSVLRRGIDVLFLLPLGVSAVLVGFGILIALDQGPLDFRSQPWIVPVAQALVALPLVIRLLLPAWSSIDPRTREAAQSLGAGPVRCFVTVDLPVLRRPLLASAALSYAICLGEFGATSFLSRPETATLPVVIGQLLGRPGADNFATAMAASVLLGVFTVAVMAGVDRLGGGRVAK